MSRRVGLVADAAIQVLAARLAVEFPGLDKEHLEGVARRQAAELTREGFRTTASVGALAKPRPRTTT